MKKRMRRPNFALLISLGCAVLIVTIWAAITGEDGGGGVLYRVAAPILVFGGLANLTGDGSSSYRRGIECYNDEHKNGIPEISSSDPPPVRGRSIFFHETSCASSRNPGGGIVLTARQACAVESAAKMNPDLEVYLLFTSPINSSRGRNPVVNQLLTYPNVKVRHLHFERYFQGSPLEEWYKGGALKASKWPRSHASDALRFLTLWKYGGTYLDLDVVVTKSLSGLSNFAGAESNTDVAAGVLNFDSEGLGHELAQACLENLRDEFRGDDWGNNGPGVITRVLKRICRARQVFSGRPRLRVPWELQSSFDISISTSDFLKVRDMTPERCRGFTVFPPSAFYPIPWRQWKLYFDEANSEKTMARLQESMVIHVWNKFSVTQNITVGSRQPYGLIAQEFCPRVYSHCGPNF